MRESILLAGEALEIQAAAGGKPPRVSMTAYSGGVMTVPGWGPIVIDLAGLEIAASVPLLADHNSELPGIVGHGEPAVSGGRLLLQGAITAANETANQIVGLAKTGFPWKASVGVEPLERRHVAAGEFITVNGQTITADGAGFTLVSRGRLREVTICAIGADPETSVAIAASRKEKRMSTDNTNATATDDQINAQMRAMLPENRPGLTDFERIQARWGREKWHDKEGLPRQRAEAAMVQAAAGRITYQDFERTLLAERLNDAELATIYASLPKGPAIHSSQRDTNPEILEAAFARTVGLSNREKAYKPETLEAADRIGAIGVQELILRGAYANGYTGGRHKIDTANLREVLQAAFAPPIQASAPSYANVGGILSNVANKVLADGFNTVEQTWREIAGRRPTPDFKTMTVYRMTDSLEYEEVGAAGEITHGELGEESYSLQAKTYAKMLALTRRDIVNDDLGAFDSIRNRLGRGAGLSLNRILWTEFLDNATFFTEARGNLIDDVLSNDPACLDAAAAHFASLTDSDGNPLGFQPAILLTGPSLAATAKRIYVASEIRDTTSDAAYATANVWQGMFKPLMSAYLEAAAIAGYSTTAWYLLCNPAVAAVIDVCFLDGREMPIIESSDADFSTLGVQFRGYHDFGVSKAEHRGGVKSTGTGGE